MTMPAIRERDFQQQVLQFAKVLGWRCYHTWLSLHSTEGFPDLVLVRPPRIVFAELKSERGKLSADQQEWLDLLAKCGLKDCTVACWRPSDWAEIEKALAR